MSLVDLIMQPGYRLEHRSMTMDFTKPVIEDKLRSSFSGGLEDGQQYILFLHKAHDGSSDSKSEKDLQHFIDNWLG